MKNKKEKIIAILLVVGLIVVTGSISYAAFRFTGLGSKVNTITTGSVTMSYTESSNVLSMSGALPTTDTTGKVRLNEGEYFDFTVSSSITGDTNINYEIAVEELDGSTMDGDFIKFYLTKVNTDGSEEEVMAPSTYSADLNANTYTGRPANMMSLYTSSMSASETTTYRLRMYVSDQYNPQGDGGNLTYKARVNVYGLAGDKVESGSGELDMSTVNIDLATNTWEDVQKVVKAGKAEEAGWKVGDTKTLTINGETKGATIIGLDHDGENTATFMVMSDIGSHAMNNDYTSAGGWEASDMRSWLNGDVYNSMSNKDQIKEVTKMTDNVGYSDNKTNTVDDVTSTQDKVFLLSVQEIGLQNQAENDWEYDYMHAIHGEGATYDWFTNHSVSDGSFWLRSPHSHTDGNFFYYGWGDLSYGLADDKYDVYAAFVIG